MLNPLKPPPSSSSPLTAPPSKPFELSLPFPLSPGALTESPTSEAVALATAVTESSRLVMNVSVIRGTYKSSNDGASP